MKLHDFIFSGKPSIRVRRHLVFWGLWWIYFAATYYYFLQVGLQKIDFGDMSMILLVNSLLLVMVHALACYGFIYFLLPEYLLKSKYVQLAAGILLLCGLLLMASYFLHAQVFPYIDRKFYANLVSPKNISWWSSINSGLLTAPRVIAAAAAIKLVKRWYQKQKEKERLEKEKLTTDLQLLKAQIRPEFLFNSLEHIYQSALRKSPEAPQLLLALSDLLSYMLYECDEQKIPLEKELLMMKKFVTLEKLKNGKEIEMEMEIKGSADNQFIAPLLLLPFIENSLTQCYHQAEHSWINMEIILQENLLVMKLMNGTGGPEGSVPVVSKEMKGVLKRLELLYPGRHEVKILAEHEIYLVSCRLCLDTLHSSHATDAFFNTNKKVTYAGT